MKRLFEILCLATVAVILAGCSEQTEYFVNDNSTETDTFNRETYDITYQLSKEQQENFAAAGYDILCSAKGVGYIDDSEDERAEDMYMFVYGGRNVELDENGVLHAYYGKETLYGYNETDKEYTVIPLIVMEEKEQTENEMSFTCSAVVSNFGITERVSRWKQDTVDVKIVVNEQYPNGRLNSVVYNETKQVADLRKYDTMEFVSSARYITRGENGEMIDFFDWEHPGKIFGVSMSLTDGSYLEMKPIEDIENYYCMFFIKDNNGNISYSELIPIKE